MICIPLKLAERPHTKQELVTLFRVDAKTIARDMDALTPHYAIGAEREGREVRYFFLEGYKYTPPNFTPAELATLLLAQRSIAATGLTSFGTALAGYGELLLQKVRSALPQSLRDKLDALSTIYGTAQVPAKDYAPHATTIDQLTTAAMERRRVRMRYYTLHNDKTSERNYDPYAVYFDPDGATLKVIGHDHKSGEIRPFSVDHIRHLQILNERFERPADWDLSSFLTKYCFNGIHGEPLTVQLRAHGATARVFAERQFHPTQQIIAQTNTSTTIEMTVARGRGLVRFILSWMPDVEVLSPTELRAEIRETLQKSVQRNA
jgi:predicted DNA-binding transcriptional regulator YafY